jgi:hypothetical protein
MNGLYQSIRFQRAGNRHSEFAVTQHKPEDWRSVGFLSALVVTPMVIAAIVAYIGSAAMPPVYAARSEIVLESLQGVEVPEQYRATQSVMTTGRSVLQPVSVTTGIAIEQLEDNLTVEFPKGSTLMRFQYADLDPTIALSTIGAVLDQYLAVVSQSDSYGLIAHRLLLPPFLLEQPIRPRPLRAAAIGAAVGLALGLGIAAAINLARKEW